MNTKNVAASLLPVVFALASLGTVGCAAESETAGDVAARETPEAATPAEALSGSARAPRAAAPAPATAAQVGASQASLRLVATDKIKNVDVTYELLDYDFGVDAPAPLGTATGGAAVAKPVLRPLSVTVRPNTKSSLLGRSLAGVAPLARVRLQRVAQDGTVTDVALFEHPFVSKMADAVGDETRESYEFQVGSLTAMDGGTSVTIDILTATATCSALTGACPCAPTMSAALGPYTQAGSLVTMLPKGSTRIDALDVEVHNDVVIGSTGSASKAVLDGITFTAPVASVGLCAMYYAGKGARVVDVHLGVAAPSTPKVAPLESTSWDACYAGVTGVGFRAGSAEEPVSETVSLGAAGLVRTDLTIDPLTGREVGKPLVSGWSFVRNTAIATCGSAVNP